MCDAHKACRVRALCLDPCGEPTLVASHYTRAITCEAHDLAKVNLGALRFVLQQGKRTLETAFIKGNAIQQTPQKQGYPACCCLQPPTHVKLSTLPRAPSSGPPSGPLQSLRPSGPEGRGRKRPSRDPGHIGHNKPHLPLFLPVSLEPPAGKITLVAPAPQHVHELGGVNNTTTRGGIHPDFIPSI